MNYFQILAVQILISLNMKQLALTTYLCLLFFLTANAQQNISSSFVSIGRGPQRTFNLEYNHLTSKKYTQSIFFQVRRTYSSGVPDDFTRGIHSPLQPEDNRINDYWVMAGGTLGKYFTLSSDLRLNLKTGPMLGLVNYPEQFIQKNYIGEPSSFIAPGDFQQKYTIDRDLRFIRGWVFQPTLEYPLSKHLGFSINYTLNINNYSTYHGAGINLIFGH